MYNGFMTNDEREKLYKKINSELWELEGMDRIGCEVDVALMDELEEMAKHLEKKLGLQPRIQNFI